MYDKELINIIRMTIRIIRRMIRRIIRRINIK